MDAEDKKKVEELCDLGICCSYAQARRVVTSGFFDKIVSRNKDKNVQGLLQDLNCWPKSSEKLGKPVKY